MNAKKTEKAEPNPQLQAAREDTERLMARTRAASERRIEVDTEKHEAAAESMERFAESVSDPDAQGDVETRAGGATPSDRVIGPDAARAPKEARRLQIETALDNKAAEARNRNASSYPFVDGEVQTDPYFKPLYDASARDPAAVNNTEAARTPNASHVGFAPFDDEDEDDGPEVSARTQEELDHGAAVIAAREKGTAPPRAKPRAKSQSAKKKQEREEAAA